jgi:hypothetical protein
MNIDIWWYFLFLFLFCFFPHFIIYLVARDNLELFVSGIEYIVIHFRELQTTRITVHKCTHPWWAKKTWSHNLRRCYRKCRWRHQKRPWPKMTSVTWPEVRASRTFLRVLALFSYYSRSTKCSTVVQVPWLPEVTSLLVIFSYTCYFFFLVHDVIKHFIFPVLFSRTFSNRNVWNTTRF